MWCERVSRFGVFVMCVKGREQKKGGGERGKLERKDEKGERRMDLGNSPTRRKVDSPNIPAQEASPPDQGM